MSGIGPGEVWSAEWALRRGEAGRLRLGPLELQLERRDSEWRVAQVIDPDPLRGDVSVAFPEAGLSLDDERTTGRFVAGEGSDRFRFVPRLADSSVVIRPARAFSLLPGVRVSVYVSTMVWVALELVPSGLILAEFPAGRVAQTWFGANTREGELCYLSRTSARLSLEGLAVRPARAVTRLWLRNTSRDAVSLERVLLPAPQLQLYLAPDGGLWTQSIEVELGDGGGDLRFVAGPPDGVDQARPLGRPRRPQDRKQLLVRALGALLG